MSHVTYVACHTCHTHVTHMYHTDNTVPHNKPQTMLCHTNNTVPHNKQQTTQTNNTVLHKQHCAKQQTTQTNNTAPHKQHWVTQQTTNNSCSACILSILSLCILPDNQSSDLLQCNATNNSMCPVAMQCNKQQNIQCNAMQYSLTTALREPYQHTLCCNAVQYQLPESCNRSTSYLIFYMMRCDGSLVRMNHTYLSFTLQAI